MTSHADDLGRSDPFPRKGPQPTPVVTVARLRRSFGTDTVIEDLNLGVASGEIHALIGPNGAGKTTLLRILAGLLAPSAGQVTVLGGSATDLANRSRIGWVPAGDRTFYLRISGRENLRFFASLYGSTGRNARRQIDRLLEEVELSHAADRPVGQYSQGMVKRLGIARALLADPGLLLFDEATHDLDPDGAESVRATVRSLVTRGSAAVWATQRLEELPGLADSVTVLRGGRPAFQGSVERLLAEATVRSFVARTRHAVPPEVLAAVTNMLGRLGTVELDDKASGRKLVIELGEQNHLGQVIGLLESHGVDVISCSEREAEIRLAFRSVTERP